MFKLLKEKLKRLLDTKKKRIVAGGLLGALLIVVAVLLYFLLRKKEGPKTVVSGNHPNEVSRDSLNQKNRTRAKKNSSARALRSKQRKNAPCEEALTAFNESVTAKADQVSLESLLDRVEDLLYVPRISSIMLERASIVLI